MTNAEECVRGGQTEPAQGRVLRGTRWRPGRAGTGAKEILLPSGCLAFDPCETAYPPALPSHGGHTRPGLAHLALSFGRVDVQVRWGRADENKGDRDQRRRRARDPKALGLSWADPEGTYTDPDSTCQRLRHDHPHAGHGSLLL